jgi:hypothetical protein
MPTERQRREEGRRQTWGSVSSVLVPPGPAYPPADTPADVCQISGKMTIMLEDRPAGGPACRSPIPRRRRCAAAHSGVVLCAALVIVLCTRVANAEDAVPKLKLRDEDGAGAAADGDKQGAMPGFRSASGSASSKQGATPGLRAEDGDPSVGGRSRDKTCAVPDDKDKPKLRGGDESAGGDAESKAANEKKAAAVREQAAAKAAAKAKEATEKAAALAKPRNGSTVIVDAVEFVDEHSDVFLEQIKQALSGGAGEDTALKDSVLDFFGGQWINSLVLCQIHEFANGSFVKVPQAVQNYTILVSRIYDRMHARRRRGNHRTGCQSSGTTLHGGRASSACRQ